MALTDQQKQEVLDIIHTNTSEYSPNFYFEGDTLTSNFPHPCMSFVKSCVVPYITDLTTIEVNINRKAFVEFPNVTSIKNLSIYPGSSVSAPELTKLNNTKSVSLSLDNVNSVYLPKLTFVRSCIIAGSNPLDDFNIQECYELIISDSSQFITRTLKRINGTLVLDRQSLIIFVSAPESIASINTYESATIIAPESSSEVFSNAIIKYSKPDIILVPEEE